MSPSIEDLLSKDSPADGSEGAELSSTLGGIQIKEKETQAQMQAQAFGIPYINLSKFPITGEAIALIPEAKAKELEIVCIFLSPKEIHLASVNPSLPKVKDLIEEIKAEKKLQPKIYQTSSHSLEQAIKLYKALPKIKKAKGKVEITEKDLENFKAKIKTFKDLATLVKEASLTEFMALVIAGAIQARASDIHIEAEEDAIKIRYRVDGVLQDAAILPHESWQKIISRIKLIAGLKLNITDKPQDGRFSISMSNDKIDVRVSCLPTAYGESVVMRLLMSSAIGLAFEDLGFRGEAQKRIEQEIKKTNGMILTTGPTGSGKTTTLYAILNKLNQPGTKIITIEDPVEYKLKGINQSQIDKTKDYTFANGLRSILRQDPDIIMVGEIRDIETADIAIDAALTGHLVISTLHTNSAAAAIPRFFSMGVKPFLLAPALNAIVGQRLCRKICDNCKVEDNLDEKKLEKIKKVLENLPEKEKSKIKMDSLKFYKGDGCDKCNKLGYYGRVGIYEVLVLDKEISNTINQGKASDADLQAKAIEKGMITMAQDGLLKALDGITSVSEVERAIGL